MGPQSSVVTWCLGLSSQREVLRMIAILAKLTASPQQDVPQLRNTFLKNPFISEQGPFLRIDFSGVTGLQALRAVSVTFNPDQLWFF